MSFGAVAVGIVGEGVAASILGGAMLGGTISIGSNVLGGRDPFENLGQGIVMGGLTGAIAPGLNDMTGVGMPAATGITAGGLTTAMTGGDLNKGLKAGLMAYGATGLAEAGSAGVQGAEAAQAQNAAATANEIGAAEAAKIAPTELTTGEAFKAGTKGISSLPTKDLIKYGAATLMGSGALDPKELDAPGGHSPEGYIRPKYYDYRTQTFYDLPAVKAKDWGSQSFDEYRRKFIADPVIAANGGLMAAARYAKGGLARFADGGLTADQKAAAQAWVAANPNATREDALSIAAASGYTPEQANLAWSQYGPAASAPAAAPAAPAYTSYTDAQAESFFKANPNIDIAAATKQVNADPAAVNRYITNLSAPYKDPTATQAGSGTLGVIQNARSQGIDPTEFASAMQAHNPDWGKDYWNQGTISHAFDVADKVLAFDPTTDEVTPSVKEWVNFMDTNSITVDDIARLTGAPINVVQARYDAAKGNPTAAVGGPNGTVLQTQVAPNSTVDTYTGGVTTTPKTYAPTGTTNPYGNYINPGDITVNPDNSRTVTPNIPGRPYGGVTGIGQVRDAYTAGGGHLGQTLKPTKSYTNTGASADVYRYLFGEAERPARTKSKPIYKDNWEGNTTEPYVWKNNTLVPNENYIDPKAPKKEEGTEEDTGLKASIRKAIAEIEAERVGVGKNGGSMPRDLRYANGGISVGSRYDPNIDGMGQNNPYSSFQPTVGRFAAGGETQYNLGSYSDGGRLLKGPGDGVSDSIPATIGRGQPARLADGEFVIPARIVSEIGNGSTDAGARKLYAMMDRVQKARGKTVGKGKVAKNTRADKYLPK